MKRWWRIKAGICFKCFATSAPGPHVWLDCENLYFCFLMFSPITHHQRSSAYFAPHSTLSPGSPTSMALLRFLGSVKLILSTMHCPLTFQDLNALLLGTKFFVWGTTPRTDYINPLAFVVGWRASHIHYCLMHTLHLGVLHHVNGGCLVCLMGFDFFGILLWSGFRN